MSDRNDIINYRIRHARLQVFIKAVLHTKYKKDKNDDDETWKFLGIKNYHWNCPVKKDIIADGIAYDKIIENIALHEVTEIQETIKTLYQELLQHKLDTYPRHTQKREKHDSKQIREDQVKELNASLFFHDPKNVGHEDCLICNMYEKRKEEQKEAEDINIATLRHNINNMFNDKATIETIEGEVKKIDSLLLKTSNVDVLTQSSIFKDLDEKSLVSELDPEVVISEIQEKIQTKINNLFYNSQSCNKDIFLRLVGVLKTIAETNPAFIGNKAGEFVYPVHRKGDTNKPPDVVKKAESLDTIQEKKDDKTQDTSSLETIIGRYNVFDENFNVKRKKNDNDFLNFSGYPLRKIVDPSIITKKFDIYTRLIGVVCSVDEIRRPNSHSLPLIYYTILIRRSLIYLFGCQQDQIFDFFKQVRILPVNKVDKGKRINSPYLLKKTMLWFLWDLICKRINNRSTEFDRSDYEKYVYPYINKELSPEGFEIISKKPLSDMIHEAGLETVKNENLKALLFHQEKNTKSKGYAGVHKITDSEWYARAVYKNRIYYYNDGRNFASQTISETKKLVENWYDKKNTPFKFVTKEQVIPESFFPTEEAAEGWVKNFWDRKDFSIPQKDVSELFTSQTKEPEKILQNTRVNIRLLDCDSFPAYHFLNYLGRKWTKEMNSRNGNVVKYFYEIKNVNESNLKEVGSWITHIDIIQQLLQIKWVENASTQES